MMKRKILLLPFATLILSSCVKTDLLYNSGAYNSPVFDENYYLEREDVDSLKVSEREIQVTSFSSDDGLDGIRNEDKGNYKWDLADDNRLFGYNNNLDNIEQAFNYGILSKLYDGRVRCDGLYQLSRVQLNKTGYATYFPKTLVTSKYIAFACRGGTTLENPYNNELLFNFKLSFYIHVTKSDTYEKLSFKLNDVPVKTDCGGRTSLVSFYLDQLEVPEIMYGTDDDKLNFLNGAVAMSLEWNCEDPHLNMYNLTDDYSIKEKDHLALMLYEVFIGKSTWF